MKKYLVTDINLSGISIFITELKASIGLTKIVHLSKSISFLIYSTEQMKIYLSRYPVLVVDKMN